MSRVRAWARELGFSQIGAAGVDLSSSEPGLSNWLARGFHGDMAYMAAHGVKRARPAELVPGTVSVITARMDYLPAATSEGWQTIELGRLQRPSEGIVSVYARGRDYHKVLRARLQKLCDRIAVEVGSFGHRVFTDSAPVLEVELAARSGIGWRGKHTLLLNREAGSMFFLGEIFLDFPLPFEALETVQYARTDPENRANQKPEPEPKLAPGAGPGNGLDPAFPAGAASHCGSCTACIDVCPTQAILSPGLLDARRCISYLTIEHQGSIPVELRPLMGNRIYGCDDCQLVCPWNKFARRSALPDFDERQGLVGQQLVTLLNWTEEEFLRHTEGSPIRRIGHERWLRNVAVALGNALRHQAAGGISTDKAVSLRGALATRIAHPSPLVREHVAWALAAI
jgi:epoxyqueuosine reductase